MTAKYIIRTSDRGQFRTCRTKWDFGSKIRQGWDYAPGIAPLDFGTTVHAGAEVYYDPETWDWLSDGRRETVHALSISHAMAEVDKQIKRASKAPNWGEEAAAKFDADKALAKAMLEHYFLWAPKRDKNLRPVKSEIEFEVPITVPKNLWADVVQRKRFEISSSPDMFLPFTLDDHDKGELAYLWFDGPDGWGIVVYQGRIDVLFEDLEYDHYVIMDHKTAAQFADMLDFLEKDQQCGSYLWGLKYELGLDVNHILYSEWRKKAPIDPPQLQNGSFSQNKQLGTKMTPEWYIKAVKEAGQDPKAYLPFLREINQSGQEFFRRNEVYRSDAQIADLHRSVVLEAIDMLDDPFIYPNPSRWNCNGCSFGQPCLMKMDGSDYQWHLEHSGYYVRNNLPKEVDVVQA